MVEWSVVGMDGCERSATVERRDTTLPPRYVSREDIDISSEPWARSLGYRSRQ